MFWLVTLLVLGGAGALWARRVARERRGAREAADFWRSSARTVVVTGAGSGIGRALAGDVLKRGEGRVRVVACDVNADAVAAAAAEDGWAGGLWCARRCDVTDRSAWQALFADAAAGKLDFGSSSAAPATAGGDSAAAAAADAAAAFKDRVDVVMNVAGVLMTGALMDLDDAGRTRAVDLTMDVNTKGLMYGSLSAAEHFEATRDLLGAAAAAGAAGEDATTTTTTMIGQIVNVTSMASLFPYKGCAVYGASKAASRSFSLAFGREVEERGIRVTAVAPDAVRTPMLDKQVGFKDLSLSFTSILEVDDIVRAITENAAINQQMELWVPFNRGALATLSNLLWDTPLPGTLSSLLLKQGSKASAAYVPSTKKE